jgi:hypothetical protein
VGLFNPMSFLPGCRDESTIPHLNPEDGGNVFLRNVCIHLQKYTVS